MRRNPTITPVRARRRPETSPKGPVVDPLVYSMSEWALDDPQILDIARASGMGRGSAVLDVGCNTGALLTLLARTFQPARCVGLDANDAALEVGRELFGDVVTLTAEIGRASCRERV